VQNSAPDADITPGDIIGPMPNVFHLLVNAIYHVSLALWLGGGIALGALTAPELFRQLARPQAGGIFAPILRRFARLRLVAIVVALAAAGTKHFVWESHTASGWIVVRWVALTFMAVAVLYEVAGLQPAMEKLRPLIADGRPDDPRRALFGRLHKRSEALLKASMVATVVAILFS
jgi:hypothetical protein